jgi:hypothetical protein
MDTTQLSGGGRVKRKQSGNKNKTLPCPHCQRLFARLVSSPFTNRADSIAAADD